MAVRGNTSGQFLKNSHILIKCKEPEFREVLKDAQFVFNAKDEVFDKVVTANGFDSYRTCSWNIEITSGEFAGYPINIAHLIEDYPLEKEDKNHIECWIVTTEWNQANLEKYLFTT